MQNTQVHSVLDEACRNVIDKLILGVILKVGESAISRHSF